MLKQQSYKTRGMQRDLSFSAFNPEFAYENMNMRLITLDENTLLSLVNEQGNKMVETIEGLPLNHLEGIPIGTQVINDELIIFTAKRTSSEDDFIYKIWLDEDNNFCGRVLYRGNLNFTPENPIESVAYYENESIKKVYWTDGVNQMRFINVANYDSSYNNTSFDFSPIMELLETVSVEKQLNSIGQFPAGTVQYVCTYFNKNGVETNPFFVSSLYYSSPANKGGSPESSFSNSFKLEMTNLLGSFDYARIYSIMRTSIDATPVVKKVVDIPIEITGSETVTIGTVENYHGVELTLAENITIYKYTTTWEVISLEDLQTMSFVVGDQIRFQGNFNIEITHKALNSTFSEWEVPSGLMSLTLNFYDDSSSPGDLAITIGIDGDSYVYAFDTSFEALNLKIFDVDDVRSIVYIDTNTFGEVVQSMVPLYLGSTKVTGGTLAHKDNVLFIGNINLLVPTIGNKNINFSGNVTYDQKFLYSEESLGIDYGYEPYSLAKSHSEISTFKGGEYYRFGILAQHETGKWSEVIWITDKQNNIYPSTVPQTSFSSVDIWGAQASMALTISNVNALIALGFKKIRGVVVYPKVNERRIVAQGFLNPTLFNVLDKFNNSPSNIPSWFLRPMANIDVSNLLQNSVQTTGNWVEFRHNKPILQPRYVGQIASTELDGLDVYTTGLPYLDAETTTPNDFVSKFKNKFFIDLSVLTFHSPDIEFDSQVQTLNNPNLNLQIIGVANLTNFRSDATIAVDSESPNLELGAGIVEFPNTGVTNYSRDNGYKQLLAAPLWKDKDYAGDFKYFWIFPWHNFNKGLENFTGEDRTKLKRKNMSNVKYSGFNLYSSSFWQPSAGIAPIKIINTKENQLFKIDEIANFPNNSLFYQANIDKVLSFPLTYIWRSDAYAGSNPEYNSEGAPTAINIKYNSNTHAVVALNWIDASTLDILPRLNNLNTRVGSGKLFWKDGSTTTVHQDNINIDYGYLNQYGGVWIGELIRNIDQSLLFGGTSPLAIQANEWYIGGAAIALVEDQSVYTLPFTEGDTFVLRYDHLMTYPNSIEDPLTITEIVSILCETRYNIDGRYDNNRGARNTLAMTPLNFNLMNEVYSQKPNYFVYRALNYDLLSLDNFPNSITWSPVKLPGSLIDNWANITMLNTLDLDGDKGGVNAIRRFNNELIAFLDRGIASILYNSRSQINTNDGVPIQLANSGTVDGKRYLSDKVGCTNKWSICEALSGLYFVDDVTKNIYVLGEGLKNLSDSLGFRSWMANKSKGVYTWNPIDFKGFKTHYDKRLGDIYFTSQSECLAYSEPLGLFTSFYSYGGVPYLINLKDKAIQLKPYHVRIPYPIDSDDYYLWTLHEGEYNYYFGEYKPFYTTIVVNPNPLLDKTFSTLEFRSDSWRITEVGYAGSLADSTFDKLTVWNEYQSGISNLTTELFKPSNLKRKFRIWRALIPRDVNQKDRMRNTWMKLKLSKELVNTDKVILHDLTVCYF